MRCKDKKNFANKFSCNNNYCYLGAKYCMNMSFDGKISNTIGALCVAGSVSLLIYLLAAGGTVWQYVCASGLLLCFVVNMWLDVTSEKKKHKGDKKS